MWDLGDLTGSVRIDAGDLLPGLRVLDVGAAVPLHAPDIERVVEKPGAAIELPADGRVAPRPASRSRNAFAVELLGDRARRVSVGKGEKDAPDIGRLGFIDAPLAMLALAVARIRLDHVVAVGLAARLLALERAAQLSAPGLLAEVGKEKLRHSAEHADMHAGDLTGGHRVELDAGEAETMVESGDVGELAAEPIERFDDEHVEEAAIEIAAQFLIARSEAAGAAERPVFVAAHERPALPLDE